MTKPRLTTTDYINAAASIGIEVPAIQAVTDVESLGIGFMIDDRPKILFERHVMYHQLIKEGGLGDAVKAALDNPDVVNRTPGGYAGGAKEWDRLAKAVTISRQCALESASWGMFQIMGYHWDSLGYANVQAFVNAMYDSEAAQLDAFTRFVRKVDPRLQRALLMKDWATFARCYNGPGYAANRYDTKMQAAYATRKAAWTAQQETKS